LWFLGYPDQAFTKSQEALALAREVAHSHSLAYALVFAALLRQLCRQESAAQEYAEEAIALSMDQELPIWGASGTVLRGWALTNQGQLEEGIAQLIQGLTFWEATGAEMVRPHFFGLLAEAYGKTGQTAKGLSLIAKALRQVEKSGERVSEAESYRLKGELSLQSRQVEDKSTTSYDKSESANLQSLTPNLQAEAGDCFLKAIEIARRQNAKSLELRAVMNLSRLWQQQGKRAEARQMLAKIYNWFTEGFGTPDLQEAKTLLEEMS
jgi:predicted ATPase